MDTKSSRSAWWVWPLIAIALIGAVAAAYFLIPKLGVIVRSAGNVVRGGEPSAVRIFLVTQGGRSPLAAVLLIMWQSLLVPLPEIPILRAVGLMWGPWLGTLINWAGLVAGATLMFWVGKALVGAPIEHFYPRKERPLGIARWVILGLRLIPIVPQDFVSLIAGTTRTRFRDFFVPTLVGTLPVAAVYAIFGESIPNRATDSLVWLGTTVGAAILASLAWTYRGKIPFGTLSAERKRTLVVGLVAVGLALGAYLLIPDFKAWVDNAAAMMAAGDVSGVRDYLLSFGVWAPVVSALLMILQSVAAPLPAFVITFSNGLLFGWAWGALLSWSSAMAGAALCFFLARSLGRPAVEKLVGGSKALEVSDKFFDRFGERAVLIARLLPFVSFDIISYGAGLTSMKFWPFFVATGLGQLPATLVYSYLGQNLTGSIRIVFLVFVITTAIFVAIAAARPLFQRWLDRGATSPSEAAEDACA